ncbi:CbrC family protein [Bacillus pseudomycoides]|nr:CbrC family protein [Bacillus pseudomycoides]MDF2085094.1 CbrC family protein [Bacillus pseudomycoides]
MQLPTFKYNPNALELGIIKKNLRLVLFAKTNVNMFIVVLSIL